MYTLGYRVPAVDGDKAIADGPVDPATTSRDTAREYGIDRQHPLRPPRRPRRVVDAPTRAGPSTPSVGGDRRAGRRCTCALPAPCAPATTATTRATRPSSPGSERLRRHGRAPAALARGPRLRGQARRRDRQRRHRGHAGARAWPTTAAHVTMLQRSPTYIVSLPGRGPARRRAAPRAAAQARATGCPRWKNVAACSMAFYQLARRRPDAREERCCKPARRAAARRATTSTRTSRPRYDPWDQRLCFVPDGDLFAAIRDGSADVVTDQHRDVHRDRHRARLRRASSPADIIVTATGLKLLAARRHRARPSTARRSTCTRPSSTRA